MEEYTIIDTWLGYEYNTDDTKMSQNVLANGTKNVLIRRGKDAGTGGSIETRNGYVTLGQEESAYNPSPNFGYSSTSSYDRYVNRNGVKVPVKEVMSIQSGGPYSEWYGYFAGKWHLLGAEGGTGVAHEAYFSEWWNSDTKLQYLVWVNGGTRIYAWTGGIGTISSVSGTTATLDSQYDLSQAGFSAAGGVFLVNGNYYTYTGVSNKDILGIANVNVGDPAIGTLVGEAAVSQYVSPTPLNGCDVVGGAVATGVKFDSVTNLNNHLFYIDWNSRDFYVSQSFPSKPEVYVSEVGSTQGVGAALNDLTVTGTYAPTSGTCTTGDEIKLVIDGVVQPTVRTFSGLFDGANFEVQGTLTTRTTLRVWIDNSFTPTFAYSVNGGAAVTGNPIFAYPGLLIAGIYVYFNTNAATSFAGNEEWTFSTGGTDTYSAYRNGTLLLSNTPTQSGFVDAGNTFDFQLSYGHRLGDYYVVTRKYTPLDPGMQQQFPFAQFAFTKPLRKTGEGFVGTLDSKPVGMKTQEEYVYVSTRSGMWHRIGFQLSGEQNSESITRNRLQSEHTNMAQRQSMMAHINNSVAYLTNDNVIKTIGRVESLDTPQSLPLSDRIKTEIKTSRYVVSENGFRNGHMLFHDNKLFVLCTQDSRIMIYDFELGFWQPPQEYPVSRLAVIDGYICGHSTFGHETYRLFTSSNDNGKSFASKVVIPYSNFGFTYRQKCASSLFTEAKVNGTSNLRASILFEYGACKRKWSERLDPVICTPNVDASIGKSQLGDHGLANIPNRPLDKFRHVQKFDKECFYEASVTYEQDHVDGYFRILATGMNAKLSDCTNGDICLAGNTEEAPNYDGTPGEIAFSNQINPESGTDGTPSFGNSFASGGPNGPSSGGTNS